MTQWVTMLAQEPGEVSLIDPLSQLAASRRRSSPLSAASTGTRGDQHRISRRPISDQPRSGPGTRFRPAPYRGQRLAASRHPTLHAPPDTVPTIQRTRWIGAHSRASSGVSTNTPPALERSGSRSSSSSAS